MVGKPAVPTARARRQRGARPPAVGRRASRSSSPWPRWRRSRRASSSPTCSRRCQLERAHVDLRAAGGGLQLVEQRRGLVVARDGLAEARDGGVVASGSGAWRPPRGRGRLGGLQALLRRDELCASRAFASWRFGAEGQEPEAAEQGDAADDEEQDAIAGGHRQPPVVVVAAVAAPRGRAGPGVAVGVVPVVPGVVVAPVVPGVVVVPVVPGVVVAPAAARGRRGGVGERRRTA